LLLGQAVVPVSAGLPALPAAAHDTGEMSKLRTEALAEFLNDWQAEHGAITREELAQAERELGLIAGEVVSRSAGGLV
jgi:hypothetical protein